MSHRHRYLSSAGMIVALALVLVLIAAGGQPMLAQDGIIYVDAYAPGPTHNGDSWDTAFTELQSALAEAGGGDQIWVATGVYTPTWQLNPEDPRSATFQMVNEVAIYGGFDPSMAATEWKDRDWVLHESILSGDIGEVGNPVDNSYHVFYHPDASGLDSTAVLDGFTVTGGNANGAWPHYEGGGMYNWESSPELTNCTFTGNQASWSGGGMYNMGSSPTLTDCRFESNSAEDGGGMENYLSSSPTLANCTFRDNSAGRYGGGMDNFSSSSPALTNCTFTGNSARYGGGIYNGSSSPTLTNSILWEDTAIELPSEIGGDPVTVTYSDIQGDLYPGDGNINVDPLFLDPDSGDFHLLPDSPCIDAGTNDAPHLPDHDFEGDPRSMDGDRDGTATADMGVDEALWHPVYLPLVLKMY